MKVLYAFMASIVALVSSEQAYISYSILKGTPNGEFRTVNLTLSLDVEQTFYNVMEYQAFREPEHWSFTSTKYPEFGQFITSIDGLANSAIKCIAWQYFITPEYPSTDNVQVPDHKYYANNSVDSTLIEDNQHFMFVYLDYDC